MKRAIALAAAATATGAAAVVALAGNPAAAHSDRLHAVLRDPSDRTVGWVRFTVDDDSMLVRAVLRPNSYVAANAFHGFHIHANNNPGNGQGCVADPAQPEASWFVSADGHLTEPGQSHGQHLGDLPSPLVQADGTALLVFRTDRIDPDVLRGRAVVLHKNPDNFGNVPTDQYSPIAADATQATAATGNAGPRVACGLVHRRH